MSIVSAKLQWKPNIFSAREALREEGPISKAPFESRQAALAAIDAWRKKHGGGADSVFLVMPGAVGWEAHRFSETRATQADVGELELTGAAALHPQSFIVDSRGNVAKLSETKRVGELQLREVKRSAFDAPVAQVGRRVLPLVEPTPQVNHGHNVKWSPKVAFRPGRDIEQLVDVIRWVGQNMPPGTKIKPGGSRHSWSPTAATDSVYLHPEGMRFIELTATNPLESVKASLPQAQKNHLVRVGAGTTIRELNAGLWAQGLAMPALGGFDGQTIAGVLPTGTHGSVLARGPLAETIQSVDLVKPNGDKVRIEPKVGPTDAKEFEKTHPGWTLIQEDRTFDASLINMGTLGVVHSYMLEVREKFYLNEVRTPTTGKAAQDVLRGGNIYNLMQNGTKPPLATSRTFASGHPAPAFHLELLWNPHSDKMAITSRHEVSAEEDARLRKKEPFDMGRPSRDLFRTISADGKYSRPQVGTALTEFFGGAIAAINDVVLKLKPGAASDMVDTAIGSLNDKQYVQRSYNVFNIGDGANQVPSQSATLSVPLRGDLYLEAVDIMRETAAKFSKEHGQWQTGPISIRFVKGSRASLGDPEDVAKFELIFSGNGPEDQKLAQQLTNTYYDALTAQLGPDVRFHWGQVVPANAQSRQQLEAAYPRFGEFDAIRRSFDPDGRMLNAWQEKLFNG